MSHYPNLPYAYGAPSAQARLKSEPADFQVEETIAFSLSGEGEHLWLWIEKQGENTDWVAQQLAKWAGIRLRDIGFAGLKDRHGITRQWFSLYLPGRENPDVSQFKFESIRILQQTRHQRKLQTGGLSGNRFILTLRDVTGDQADTEQRLKQIQTQGVPNYFGEQRFGRSEHNLVMAQRFFDGELTRLKPSQRGLYISAARSFMFNEVLAERVRQQAWNQAWSGDVFQLEGSDKWFVDDGSTELVARVNELDIHPTGALVGAGELATQQNALKLETQVLAKHQAWCQALADLGLKQERRALRVLPKNLSWLWLDNQTLQVCFDLAPGRYATVIMRELFAIHAL